MTPSIVQAALGTAGALAGAAYLDARFLIRNDLKTGSHNWNTKNAAKFVTKQFALGKGLIYDVFESHALGKNSNNIFLIFEGQSWTYKQFYDDVQRVGNWLLKDLQVQRGEMIALNGQNSPEYVMILLAANAINASTAYINSHLTAAPLNHSVKLCGARYLLADRSVEPLVNPCEQDLREAGVQTIYFDQRFIAGLQDTESLPISRRQGVNPDAVARLIYTSGTTGLPKGVKLSYAREILSGSMISKYQNLKPGVRMYTCLPLYHVSGHNLCTIPSIFAGSTVVLSRKFSHKRFWPEVRSSKAQIVQHVGELLRYLLNAPPSPLDKEHNVRKVWGNGIRPDVWEAFRQRFGIETVNEIYGATDGFSTTMNANRGGFGRNAVAIRGLLWHVFNGAREKRIHIDVDTEDVLRGPDGFAIPCKTGEIGEMIHKVDPKMEDATFSRYYKNENAGEKKKLRDVFEKGDLWFRTGDLMRDDSDGCVYFVDRLGDTFRWKSENVSTNEVGEVLGAFEQIAEINVFGSQVPHADGRAGCAAIVPVADGKDFDFEGLANHAITNLPRYAVPLFIRMATEIEYTATMKLQKGRLKAEGIDWDKIRQSNTGDKFYWLPPSENKYVPYGQVEWEMLQTGQVKF